MELDRIIEALILIKIAEKISSFKPSKIVVNIVYPRHEHVIEYENFIPLNAEISIHSAVLTNTTLYGEVYVSS